MLETRPPIPSVGTGAARARRAFVANLCTYVAVNAALVIIWLVTRSSGDAFWPIWPIALWGIGVVAQGWRAYRLTRRADMRLLRDPR